ncbi:MAG: T9SS type A sorting domain-containing protein [Bacteroidetes bacterium]|nr:T9SS type A sorting domain-containing protein [Fibrella sp.]
MRNILICLLLVAIWAVPAAYSQDVSSFSVRYLITHDAASKQFTAWVVPDYNTPNANNPDTDERGVTAQFSLKVPQSFRLTDVQDVRGNWDKKAIKIEPQRYLVNPATDGYAYYMIGKAPTETSYGEFKQGEPVALFTFRGDGAEASQVQALEVNDPFIDVADKVLSLNVRGSFYSRSGQDFKPNTRPVEQFAKTTSLSAVLKEVRNKDAAAAQASAEEPTGNVLLYPNPVQQVLNVAYFSEKAQAPAVVEWIDLQGVVRQSKQAVAKQGLNTMQLDVVTYPGGAYFLRTTVNGKSTTGKVNKL